MKIVNLLPLSLSLTHVGDIVYLKKKGRIVRFLLTTFGKVEVQGAMFFYIETIPRDCDRQRSTKIAVEGKTFILVHNY